MNLINKIFGEWRTVQCGAFGCARTFMVDATKPIPEIPICRQCEKRFNQGIVQDVHAHTGRLQGSYNIFDERYIH